MGNLQAAGPAGGPGVSVAPPPPPSMPGVGMAPPPMPPGTTSPTSPQSSTETTPDSIPKIEEVGPGTFEDLHKKCKEVFPVPFEGAKLLVNKGLSNHFQISHTLTMSSFQPSGYKFGCTYVGTKQYTPTEAYPILIGDIDPSGNLNANIIHHLTRSIRCKFVAQIQGSRWLATQFTTDYRGTDCTASLTIGNPDIIAESGVIVGQYIQNVTKRLAVGTELLYQYGGQIPGNEIAIYTLAGRYTADDWQLSANLTPLAGGLHTCFYRKVNESTQVGVELEGSLRTRECTTTVGYQIDMPSANFVFRGQLDSNWQVGAVLEKRLPPLPFTFVLSAMANHIKSSYRFGIGIIVG